MTTTHKLNNVLADVCKILGTQGGVLWDYDRKYIALQSAFGSWHKHCSKDKVLFLGYTLSDLTFKTPKEFYENHSNNNSLGLYKGYEVDVKIYDEWRKKSYAVETEKTLFLIPLEHCKPFDVNLIDNDRF